MNNIEANKTPDTVRLSAPVVFRAIDRYIESNIVKATETKSRGGDRVQWGDNNAYPDYLLSLYKDVATLGSIVNGCVDYTAGNDVTLLSPLFPEGKCNRLGELAVDIVRGAAQDWFLFGGFAFEVIRGRDGNPAEIYNMGMEKLRTNEDCTVFYWSDNWAKGGRDKKTYAAFMPDLAAKWATLTPEEQDRHAASILYVKNTRKQVYPMPLYAQAVKDCEIERSIEEYFLNALENSFMASVFIQLCNGVPQSDDVRQEIIDDLNEMYAGKDNAGRMMVSFSPDRQHSAVIQELKADDFGTQFQELAKRSRQQIFTSFRANPNLFGIPTDSLGFSSEEYESAFNLFNRTQIVPVQGRIADAFERVCGAPGVFQIQPFSLGGGVPVTD